MKLASMARGHANLRNQIAIKTANGDEQNRDRRSICATTNLNAHVRSGSRATGLRCPRDVRLFREQTFRYGLLSNSGCLAILTAMRRASSLLKSFAAACRPGSSSKLT